MYLRYWKNQVRCILSCARIPVSLFFSGKDRTYLLACLPASLRSRKSFRKHRGGNGGLTQQRKLSCLQAGDIAVRMLAARTLGEVADAEPEVDELGHSALSAEDAARRDKAGVFHEAVAALLADQNDDVKVVAIVALGKMGEYGELHAGEVADLCDSNNDAVKKKAPLLAVLRNT